jgi:hypothetical protein
MFRNLNKKHKEEEKHIILHYKKRTNLKSATPMVAA